MGVRTHVRGTPARNRRAEGGVLLCLAVAFVLLQAVSLTRRSATWDEPIHLTAGYFALADGDRLRQIVEEAGFSDVKLEECTVPMSNWDKGADYIPYIIDLAGPIAVLFNKVPQEKRGAVAAEMAAEIEKAGGGTARVNGVAWIVTARA